MEKRYWFFFCSTEFNLSLISLEFKIFGSGCLPLANPFVELDESSSLLSLEDLQNQKTLLMFPNASKGDPLTHMSMREVRPFWNVMKAASKASFTAVKEMSFRAAQAPKAQGRKLWSITACKDTWAVDQLSQYRIWRLGFVLHSAAGSVCHNLVTQGQRCRGSRSERPEGWHCHRLALLMCPSRDQQILRQGKSIDAAEMFGFCLFASRFSQFFSGHRSGFNLVTVKVQGSAWTRHQVFPASLHKSHLI